MRLICAGFLTPVGLGDTLCDRRHLVSPADIRGRQSLNVGRFFLKVGDLLVRHLATGLSDYHFAHSDRVPHISITDI
jgi:hypothetical protein